MPRKTYKDEAGYFPPFKGYFDSKEVQAVHSFCNKIPGLIWKVSYLETANSIDSTLTEYATRVKMQQ